LAIITMMRVEMTALCAGESESGPPGSGSQFSWMPDTTRMPAATVSPASLEIGSRSTTSSTAPTIAITTLARTSAQASPLISGSMPRNGRCVATTNAATTPASTERPPRRGIRTVWTSRSRIGLIAPILAAKRRARPPSR
jgi:hypothetical protein